ncbi:hypothetical protein BsWGS_28593 [Bradybaena similaris]
MSLSYNRTHGLFGNDTHRVYRAVFDKTEKTYYKVNDFDEHQKVLLVVVVHMIYITGIPGNIVTLIVLQKKALNDNFVSVFLSTMCVVDLWCLLTGFSAYWWMAVNNGHDFREDSYFACLYHWLVTLIGLQVSQWIIVLISACRIHLVLKRSKKHKNPSRTPALLIMAGLVTVIVVPGVYMVKGSLNIAYKDGEIIECDVILGTDLRLIYFALTLFLPPVLVIIENWIMHYLYRRSMPAHMRLRPSNITANHRMKMLIVMTDVMFFITNIPPLVFHEVSKRFFPPHDELAAIDTKFEMVLIFSVLYCGFAYNIVIYCCFGRHFRGELKLLLLTSAHRLGLCQDLSIQNRKSLRVVEPIPFSVFTSSTGYDRDGSSNVTETKRSSNEPRAMSSEPSMAKIELEEDVNQREETDIVTTTTPTGLQLEEIDSQV